MTAVDPQSSSGLVNNIRTASVVMLNMNIADKRLIPKGVLWVNDIPREEKPQHEPGRMLFKHRSVDTSDILRDLEIGGYVAGSLVGVERRQGFRVSGILIRKESLRPGMEQLSRPGMSCLTQLLEENIWDVTAYRNPGENGGNYSLELGNPISGHTSADILCVEQDESVTVCRP